MEVSGSTVRDVLEKVFCENATARRYILDDQGALRPHIVIFVDGNPVADRKHFQDKVNCDSEIYIMQALSGG